MARSSSHPAAGAARLLPACLAVLVAVPALPGRARADSAAEAEAEVLFTQARSLMAEKKYRQACPKLERSEALDPQIGTGFNLARCYELGGLLASAWLTYARVIDETRAAGQLERQAVAERLAVQLAPRVAHVSIHPPAGFPRAGLEIRCDGALVPERFWDQPRPTDPGPHVVDARAPGSASWRGSFEIDRDGQAIDLDIPSLARIWPTLASPLAPLPAKLAPLGPRPASGSRGRLQREMAAVLGGLSLVGIGIGTFYGLRTASLSSQARPLCDGAECEARSFGMMDEARKDGNVSTVAFTMAASLLAGAAVVWLTAPRGAEVEPRP